jgi:dimethylglycine dehydrogenase
VRDASGLLDLTGFSRFELTGEGAARWLDSLICGRLPKIGRTTLAYFCSPKGGIVTEMTVTRFAENRFWLITAAAAEWHDRDWLVQLLPAGNALRLANVTTRYGALVLVGPQSRALLASLTDAPLDNAAFPWLGVREIEIGPSRLVAMRVNYVGELGWELHVPIENMLPVYDLIVSAGIKHGLRHFGLYAMDSMRLEKGYRGWKTELTTELTPIELGLERFLTMDKPDFIGKTALQAHRPRFSFVQLRVEPGPAEALYGSPVHAGDRVVGYVASGGYGHRVEASLALALVRPEYSNAGSALEIDILGVRRKTELLSEAPYDPQNERLRA